LLDAVLEAANEAKGIDLIAEKVAVIFGVASFPFDFDGVGQAEFAVADRRRDFDA
jgi:hypothetical protein